MTHNNIYSTQQLIEKIVSFSYTIELLVNDIESNADVLQDQAARLRNLQEDIETLVRKIELKNPPKHIQEEL